MPQDTKQLSCRIPESLMVSLEAEAQRRKVTITDTVIKALSEYISKDTRQSNMDILVYEIVKTRAFIQRGILLLGKSFSEEEKEEAGRDAEAYLEQRRSNHG